MPEFRNVDFSYGEKSILKNFSFSVNEGETTAVLGPSGFGKTTLLELFAEFLKPQKGEIVPFCKKPVFIFQEDRLLPWFSVLENMTAVNIKKEKALLYLQKVGLSDSLDKYPEELSGGMCRRLAIARALAFGGNCFLFDEPLRGLDIKTSAEILELIKAETAGKTALVITHSPNEAFFLCERIVVVGKNPLEILADKKRNDFPDEKALADFLETVIK